ncbi:MAG: glutamate 5-kinase [Nitrospirae bacterium]|nr:glutamate 5-kinase [Nitrospirota bacterium]MCL5422556.1 glutamate 5-kinase [Nitrospirota bacterium]
MRRLVIKIGSNILTSDNNGLDLQRIQSITDDISAVKDAGHEVVIVSSGAVAAGMKKLELKEKPKDIILKQAAAAVGQSSLMWAYEKCFGAHGNKVAQILLTRDDFADRKRYINSRNTLITLLSYEVIPIINENDTVATDEIRFGDNDNLASLVAGLIDAERFIILSDVDGLFNDDPRENPKAKLIEVVEKITPDLEKRAGGSGSAVGTGGMFSKLLAAKRAVHHGITVNIINGRTKGVISSLLSGTHHGTEFRPQETRLSSKKGWIAYACRTKGSITVDEGAARALLHGGKSLLPSGIVSLSGSFEAGDAVYCLDPGGRRIAKGLTNYSSAEIEEIKGKKTSEIEGILGYQYSDEVIHRDNLVLL